MENDERIDVRVAVLEYRVDSLLEIVEEVRANYVTRAHLDEVVSHLASKEEVKLLATKEEIKLLATREELRQVEQNIRNCLIGLFFTLFFSLAGLQLAMFQLYRHAS